MSGPAIHPLVVAMCINCACDDDAACHGGCSWLRVDYELGVGVCSNCPEACAAFDQAFGPEPGEKLPAPVLVRVA